jgi:NADH:ubiquinone oxidoreductase subunit 4 (subunit M)
MSQLVLLLLLVPLAGGLVTLFLRNSGHEFARKLALGFFLLNLFISLKLTWDYLPLLEKHSVFVDEKLTFVPLNVSVTAFDLIRFQAPQEGRC